MAKKNQKFLALKGTLGGRSCFITNPLLKTRYEKGKQYKCIHPDLPFFIATMDNIHFQNMDIGTAFDAIWLVEVSAKDISMSVPWRSVDSNVFDGIRDRKTLAKSIYSDPNTPYWGARSLKMIATIRHRDMDVPLKDYIQKVAEKYKLPLATDALFTEALKK